MSYPFTRTGLSPSPLRKVYRPIKNNKIELETVAQPAPYTLKPFAGLYNPYPYGCSLLCNHPTDYEAKLFLKKAKISWNTEGRNLLLTEEIATIRENIVKLQNLQIISKEEDLKDINLTLPDTDIVPEELFRRYTETDSRPLTPAPTLVSAATRASGSRRCVTPDPFPKVKEKTTIVLDLRRSHSQETLSCIGSSFMDHPVIKIDTVPTQVTEEKIDVKVGRRAKTPIQRSPQHSSRLKIGKHIINKVDDPVMNSEINPEDFEDSENQSSDDEFIRRRGKRRRRKKRQGSGPLTFQMSIDPETQVATIGIESRNPSGRPSLVPDSSICQEDLSEAHNIEDKKVDSEKPSNKFVKIDSFLDLDILRCLRRELNEEAVDNEFDIKRRKALEEALKTVPKERILCEELTSLKNEMKIPAISLERWMKLPRKFSRSNVRFELPLDSRIFSTLTPIDYLEDHVFVNDSQKLLYNCVFNKFKKEEFGTEVERKISGKNLHKALDIIMGQKMSSQQSDYLRGLIGWKDDDILNFKIFCGICATCERLLAPEFYPQLLSRKEDPPQEIEIADFGPLDRKLNGQNVDDRLIKILHGIQSL